MMNSLRFKFNNLKIIELDILSKSMSMLTPKHVVGVNGDMYSRSY